MTAYSEGKAETDYLQCLDKDGLREQEIPRYFATPEVKKDPLTLRFPHFSTQAFTKTWKALGAVLVDSVAVRI